MRHPGNQHELAGQLLLLENGVASPLARFCVTHASWDQPGTVVEDLLVALADKLWKGKRADDLEQRLTDVIARDTNRDTWAVFGTLDTICEAIAVDGPSRLARSDV